MALNEQITTIIFDLGGVLLNIDYMLTQRAFEVLGLSAFEEVYTQHQQSGVFDQFEKGVIDAKAFTQSIRQQLPQCDETAITDAWNAMLLDFPDARMQLLKRLANDYTLVLFSNTNEIHYTAFNHILDTSGLPRLQNVFDHTLFSHKIGIRKPEQAGFDMALKLAGCVPQQCLFIDDSIQHIEGARSMGIHTYHLQEGDVLSLFPDKVL